MFGRVLIANRGEVAVRIIRACRELGVETVAVYSTADRDALHVRLADRAVHIGPPLPAQSYLISRRSSPPPRRPSCDAVHPGWGFLAENAAFAARLRGQRPRLHRAARRRRSRRWATRWRPKTRWPRPGVPLVPGSKGAVGLEGPRASRRGRLSCPAQGRRRAAAGEECGSSSLPTTWKRAYQTASSEAQAAFGDGSLYVEKAVVGARHVEIQVLGDGEGGVLTLGERDCSIQRRHQKLVEEAPSPAARRRAARRDGGRSRAAPARRSATAARGRSSSSSTRTAASTSSR